MRALCKLRGRVRWHNQPNRNIARHLRRNLCSECQQKSSTFTTSNGSQNASHQLRQDDAGKYFDFMMSARAFVHLHSLALATCFPFVRFARASPPLPVCHIVCTKVFLLQTVRFFYLPAFPSRSTVCCAPFFCAAFHSTFKCYSTVVYLVGNLFQQVLPKLQIWIYFPCGFFAGRCVCVCVCRAAPIRSRPCTLFHNLIVFPHSEQLEKCSSPAKPSTALSDRCSTNGGPSPAPRHPAAAASIDERPEW